MLTSAAIRAAELLAIVVAAGTAILAVKRRRWRPGSPPRRAYPERLVACRPPALVGD